MSGTFDRKAALRAYKERKPRPGIFALRHRASGRCWVGTAPDLDCAWTRTQVRLREGRHLDKGLQQAWHTYGEEAFDLEVLEVLEGDLEGVYLTDALKARKAHWAAKLA